LYCYINYCILCNEKAGKNRKKAELSCGNTTEDDEESGIPRPDYVQLLGELFRSLCGEDDSDSTLVNDQVVSIGESQIIG